MITMETITILVADDHPIVRAGLRLLLDEEPDLTVVAEAGDGEEAIAKALELAPDVVLLDVMMPNTNGLEAAKRIRQETSCRILMLSMQDDPGYVRRAFASGASGYVLKEVAHTQLVSAVRSVAAGPSTSTRIWRPSWRPTAPTMRSKTTTRCRSESARCCSCSHLATPTRRSPSGWESASARPRLIGQV
jgi:DNA-binding NarL/FixJ family response regulator